MFNQRIKIIIISAGLSVLLSFTYLHAAVPTFQELMNPKVFPDAQRGMEVKSAAINNGVLKIETTGARMEWFCAAGKIIFSQRLVRDRELLTIEIKANDSMPKLTHTGAGLAFASFDSPKVDLRANGDSLFMFHAIEPIEIVIRRNKNFFSIFNQTYRSNHLMLDEFGGFGIYCSEEQAGENFSPFEDVTAVYKLPIDAVLWIGICPPQHYDWQRSLEDQVIWHWSNELSYPPDEVLKSWKGQGNIVLLQGEVMLWKDWNLDFVPRLGTNEWNRVKNTIHDLGMRYIVYTSPSYFLKGLPQENTAINNFENFITWPQGTASGENMDLFMEAITKVVKELDPDGLYFDGQYFENPAGLYKLARASRELLGDDKLLEWHSSVALGKGLCFLPHADAYTDFVFRGENKITEEQIDPTFLQYFVSCYNSSNTVGVLCEQKAWPILMPENCKQILDANARLHIRADWLSDANAMDCFNNFYRVKLNTDLQKRADNIREKQHEKIKQKWQKLADEDRWLRGNTKFDQTVFRYSFDKMPDWQQVVSPLNGDPFSNEDGSLSIEALGNTYAYLTKPMDATLRGFEVKIKHGTDMGASWGPALAIRWSNGAFLRIGTRSDKQLQSDINAAQVVGASFELDNWLWIRGYWSVTKGAIEISTDGKNWERIRDIEHKGLFMQPAETLYIGKLPYNGEPFDYTEASDKGKSYFEYVILY